MKVILKPPRKDWENLLKRPAIDNSKLEPAVAKILQEVKANGDAALKAFSVQFDKVAIDNLAVTEIEFEEAQNLVSEELKQAIQTAIANIEKFHRSQQEAVIMVDIMEGVKCWRKSVPIEKVGLYIPGGSAPLFSTVLMLGIPAKIAGCKEIIMCTPPGLDQKIHPAILYAASCVGIKKVYKTGGAQAIAAMAFGTQTIPKVFKIFGPGNQYVTMAKMLVSMSGVAIDMPAGPSEVLVVADKTAYEEFIAADLLAQAEHGADSQVILLTKSGRLIESVMEELHNQSKELERKDIADKALDHSKAILLSSDEEIIEMMNAYAPEHLILMVENYMEWIDKIENAGSVFLGHYSPESAGDYASGTNHTLPTNGFAKSFSGVSLDSFVKKITFQELTEKGIMNLGKTVEIMAEEEQLQAHKNAVTIRLNMISKNK
jgi:histidinol dehydrogenase